MNRRLTFLPEAKADLAHIYDWYEEQKSGHGEAFAFAFDACVSLMEQMPLIFPRVHKQFRKALLRRFPYKIYYVVLEGEIRVVAVVHSSMRNRRPRRL